MKIKDFDLFLLVCMDERRFIRAAGGLGLLFFMMK